MAWLSTATFKVAVLLTQQLSAPCTTHTHKKRMNECIGKMKYFALSLIENEQFVVL